MIVGLKCHIIKNVRIFSPRGPPLIERVYKVEDDEDQKDQEQNEQDSQRGHDRENGETIGCSVEQFIGLQLGRTESDLHGR